MNNQKEWAATDCPRRTNRACFKAIEGKTHWLWLSNVPARHWQAMAKKNSIYITYSSLIVNCNIPAHFIPVSYTSPKNVLFCKNNESIWENFINDQLLVVDVYTVLRSEHLVNKFSCKIQNTELRNSMHEFLRHHFLKSMWQISCRYPTEGICSNSNSGVRSVASMCRHLCLKPRRWSIVHIWHLDGKARCAMELARLMKVFRSYWQVSETWPKNDTKINKFKLFLPYLQPQIHGIHV